MFTCMWRMVEMWYPNTHTCKHEWRMVEMWYPKGYHISTILHSF
jgi:hypothetical protein